MAEDAQAVASPSTVRIIVAASLDPGAVKEWTLDLNNGACVADALRACGFDPADERFSSSVWGRVVPHAQALRDLDRVEWCRSLLVDPKVARRERFARQGARTAGLFADRRPGAKAGY
ncbi:MULTISPECIES: RnfH family protein [unclassified Acidovorax]|uniref:RnfH family protein n=1 Tax=unclassified Acidovorax TaxID=2684926 RepID=UPI0028835260|nr:MULTISPECIES: RnfH family protein [unclassified Acidovorax]